MVLKQSWNKWTKLANCLFLISPTRTPTICLFTIYVSNVTLTHLETWKCVYNLIRDVSNHPASFSRLERDNVNTVFKWNPAIWTWKIQWNYYHPLNHVTRVFLEDKLKSLGNSKRGGGHMVHYFKDIWAPIVLARYCFNYFGSCIQSGLNISKCKLLYDFLLWEGWIFLRVDIFTVNLWRRHFSNISFRVSLLHFSITKQTY